MASTRTATSQLARQFRSAFIPIYVLDPKRTIVFCNEALADWTGLEAASLVGMRVDYDAGSDPTGLPGVAAGLCPPATVEDGTVAHVSCISRSGRLLHRRAQFVPLSPGEPNSPLVAFLDREDLSATELPQITGANPPSDALHIAIRTFRASQKSRYGLAQLIGQTPAINQVRAAVRAAAACRENVLILGPPGSGRSHIAKTIHYESTREDSDRLVTIEGALTDADSLRSLLDRSTESNADSRNTTIFLADADQLAPDGQMLLDEALASRRPPSRILSTSRGRLIELARIGSYHFDLACRLSSLELTLPPLKDRISDLPLLAQVFLEEQNQASTRQIGDISSAALDILALHAWPNNLDELRGTIQQAREKCPSMQIEPAHLPDRLLHASLAARYPKPEEQSIHLEQFLAEIETELIGRALKQAKENKTKAAELLGMTRPRFYRRLEQLGLLDASD